MPDDEVVEVSVARLRHVIHAYNNIAARLLTRAEVALLDDDGPAWRAALESVCNDAEDLARFTREVRAEFLADD